MKNYRPTATSVRSVRLAAGMVLMAYVTGHLTNLAFDWSHSICSTVCAFR
jgi:hypothetical protein